MFYRTEFVIYWCDRLPNYVKKSIVGPMQSIAELSFKMDTNTPTLARLKYGFLLKEILEHFTQKIDGTLEPSRLLWLYSAHDFTISGLLNSLGLLEVIFMAIRFKRTILLKKLK